MSDVKVRLTQKGQGLVEYALILVLVAIVVFAVLMLLGPVIGNTFSSISNSLSSL
ncbi:MAG: pilus assembly protein [Anaerolinea sp. RIFOXYB12_FULL_60_12]|nr:MAG: pilus assembly protein [Anaerolinea sp. RIFOXYB12_FULL_60_12]OGO74573.1 MAG: pilus assembly protein [Chloroflexi bacterium RIFOXYD12_FULL_57_15]